MMEQPKNELFKFDLIESADMAFDTTSECSKGIRCVDQHIHIHDAEYEYETLDDELFTKIARIAKNKFGVNISNPKCFFDMWQHIYNDKYEGTYHYGSRPLNDEGFDSVIPFQNEICLARYYDCCFETLIADNGQILEQTRSYLGFYLTKNVDYASWPGKGEFGELVNGLVEHPIGLKWLQNNGTDYTGWAKVPGTPFYMQMFVDWDDFRIAVEV